VASESSSSTRKQVSQLSALLQALNITLQRYLTAVKGVDYRKQKNDVLTNGART
jgi:hypothetical protein